MDYLDELVKAIMSKEEYEQLLERQKIYRELQPKRDAEKLKRKIEQRKRIRRRFNSR